MFLTVFWPTLQIYDSPDKSGMLSYLKSPGTVKLNNNQLSDVL